MGDQWTIRTPDGFYYEFFKAEYYSGNELIGQSGQHKTAWYLTKIVSPKGNTVTFNYTELDNYVTGGAKYSEVNSVMTYGSYAEGSAVHSYGECTSPQSIKEPVPGRQYRNIQLDNITFDEGYIKFHYNAREDILNDQKLYRIEMYSKTGVSSDAFEKIRSIDLEYGYFVGEQSLQQSSAVFGITKRLKLKRVYDKSRNDQKGYDYKFDYYKEYDDKSFLPSKVSFARDHWGYYNGRTGNTSLIPGYSSLQSDHLARKAIGIMGDERDPGSGDHASFFALKKMWYPTGGYSEFEYEPHAYDRSNSTDRDGSFFAQSVDANQTQDSQFVIDGDTPGIYPTSFAQAQADSRVLDLTTGLTSPGGNVVVSMNTFFLFNSLQSSCVFPGHTLTFEIVGENGTVHYSADIFNLLNESVNPATCTGTSYYTGINRLQSFGVPPGKYYFRVNIPIGENLFSIIKPVFTFLTSSSGGVGLSTREIGGGIRIKRISTYDAPSATPEVQRFLYDYLLDKNGDGIMEMYSAGRRSGRPEYSYFEYQEGVKCSGVINTCVIYRCETLKRNGDGIMALSATGSPVSYDQVTVLQGENGENGKTEYTYYNASPRIYSYTDYSYLTGPSTLPRRPPAYPSLFDPMHGSLQKQIDYRYVSSTNSFIPVHKFENNWFDGQPSQNAIIWGMERRTVANHPYIPCWFTNLIYPVIQSSWVYLASTAETTYDQTDVSKQSATWKVYDYSNVHYQVTKAEERMPDKTLVQTFKYPADYADAALPTFMKKMRDDFFIHTPIVEAKTIQIVNSVESVLAHNIQTFAEVNTDKIFPVSTVSLLADKPLDPSNVPVYVPLSGPDVNKYRTNFTLEYNSVNEVKSIRKPNDAKTAYLWGYQNTSPIAEVVNCDPKDAYYTSFEDFGQGNSSDAKTGKKSRTGGFSTTLNNLTQGNYLLTYWQKVTDWQLVTAPVTVGVDASYSINVSGHVDEIRFFPAGAQIKTFTYNPMVGIYETIDANNRVTRFEYDPFNRLHLIKDNDGNIVKRYTYFYKVK
jgi:YD repeat-containing protein